MTKSADVRLSLEELVAASHDDYSNAFGKIRSRLTNRDDVRLADFVHGLKPMYRRVYQDIAMGYAALIGTIVLACVGQLIGISPVVLAALGTILVGYFAQYLMSFIHEGAHWNLAADRRANDLLCNVLISWIIGLEVHSYRKVHFEHHRSLGTIDDTEYSYFFPLNAIFIAKGIFGVRALQTLWSYRESASAREARPQRKVKLADRIAPHLPQVAGAAVHALIIGGLWWYGFTAAAVAWLLGIGVALPLFGSIRQLLEHRSEEARSSVDYSVTDQGACARMFGDGWFARTFGSAGFNRHLLHHWEPQVSYTRLGDLERFLADTPMRVVMDRRRTSYAETFRRLFSLY
jgi:fatty acid desaturase